MIHDHSVSAAHCEILVFGTEVIVRDLDSRNGTLVEGVRLKNQHCPVPHGQTVRFGSVEARLELDTAEDEEPTSEISAIYAHRRAQRDPRRAHEQLPPPAPSMHGEPSADPLAEEHTVLLPAQLLPAPLPTPSAPPKVEPDAGLGSKGRYVAVAAVITVGVVVLLWLVWHWP